MKNVLSMIRPKQPPRLVRECSMCPRGDGMHPASPVDWPVLDGAARPVDSKKRLGTGSLLLLPDSEFSTRQPALFGEMTASQWLAPRDSQGAGSVGLCPPVAGAAQEARLPRPVPVEPGPRSVNAQRAVAWIPQPDPLRRAAAEPPKFRAHARFPRLQRLAQARVLPAPCDARPTAIPSQDVPHAGNMRSPGARLSLRVMLPSVATQRLTRRAPLAASDTVPHPLKIATGGVQTLRRIPRIGPALPGGGFRLPLPEAPLAVRKPPSGIGVLLQELNARTYLLPFRIRPAGALAGTRSNPRFPSIAVRRRYRAWQNGLLDLAAQPVCTQPAAFPRGGAEPVRRRQLLFPALWRVPVYFEPPVRRGRAAAMVLSSCEFTPGCPAQPPVWRPATVRAPVMPD